ncbi:MAG: beta-ketoacyl-ACP synthase [Gemmatimonadaceae bacterium]|jgi:3-oxoacyl-[acyl-carrier-protein] synthase-1|nr:beta-ketoacyl-ACP synthase [Gemmatimonadaceae bacterium]
MSAALFLHAAGVACALGADAATVRRRLLAGESGVTPTTDFAGAAPLPLGVVREALPDAHDWPIAFRSRNNQLAWLAGAQLEAPVHEAIARHGAARVAIIVGTSTSGIGESEVALGAHARGGALPAHFDLAQQEIGSLAHFLAYRYGTRGPAYVHSSACASGPKAMAAAARLLNAGLADAVITGGVDSLCAFTVAGFSALGLVSTARTTPFSANRGGINIGEAAALFLMTREPATVRLAGWGESSDGHHFSAPDPSGRGAHAALTAALARAGVAPHDVDYVNMHATGTRANDSMEGAVMHALFGDGVPASGTKAATGHALGAAGAIETAFCWLAMQDDNAHGALPPHGWDGVADPELPPVRLVRAGETLGHPPRVTVSTSFAFGGANAAVVLARDGALA